MTRKTMILLECVVLSSALLLGTKSAGALNVATSELLLPYFEVDLSGAGVRTLFSVVNSSPEAVPVTISVHTNWGIEVLRSSIEIDGDAVRTVDLRTWILTGTLPNRALDDDELEHFQAALTGRPSPRDDLYYSVAELEAKLAVGYVKIKVDEAAARRDVLFGEYFIVDETQDFAQGDSLVDVIEADRPGLCQRHGVRFLSGGGFDSGTEIVVWTDHDGRPSASPYLLDMGATAADALVYRESGQQIDHLGLSFLPLQVIRVSDLGLSSPFGWLDIVTDRPAVISLRLSASNRYSVGFQTFCLPSPPEPIVDDTLPIDGLPPVNATLTLVKKVVNDDGGVLGVADFALFIDGEPVTSGVASTLPPGIYKASEQNRNGYTAGEWQGDCAADGTVTLNPGEHKRCEITNDDKGYLPLVTPDRMTGGGSVLTADERFTHGFELHCVAGGSDNLEINWGRAKAHRFQLSALDSGTCSDEPAILEGPPAAGFDTFAGRGRGSLNGVDGATITFTFTDAGESGTADRSSFTIVPPDGGEAVIVSGLLHSGNHQAHGR